MEKKDNIKEDIELYINALNDAMLNKTIVKIEPPDYICADGNFIITLNDGTWVQFYNDEDGIQWGIGKE